MICRICRINKSEDSFSIRETGKRRTDCKACCVERSQRHYKPELKSKYDAEYRAKNIDKIRARLKANASRIRAYKKRRYDTDVKYKVANALRVRVRKALKGNFKATNTLKMLGCHLDTFKAYIESKWKPGMTWSNYSYYGWHLDHIIPCARFDLSKPEEQLKCFHYKNLQPLWRKENQSKGDKIYGTPMQIQS